MEIDSGKRTPGWETEEPKQHLERRNHISVRDSGSRAAKQGVKEDWVTEFIWTHRNFWDKIPDKEAQDPKADLVQP